MSLADMSAFTGTMWFVILVGVACFAAGVALCPKARKMMGMSSCYTTTCKKKKK